MATLRESSEASLQLRRGDLRFDAKLMASVSDVRLDEHSVRTLRLFEVGNRSRCRSTAECRYTEQRVVKTTDARLRWLETKRFPTAHSCGRSKAPVLGRWPFFSFSDPLSSSLYANEQLRPDPRRRPRQQPSWWLRNRSLRGRTAVEKRNIFPFKYSPQVLWRN